MTDDTLRMLRDSAANFAKLAPARVRSLRTTRPGFDRGVWQQMADLGWLGVLVPETHEGLDLGMKAAVIIAEQLGRALYPEPYCASAVLATLALRHGDGEALKRRYLPQLAAGQLLVGLAWQGESGGLDIARCGVRTRRHEGKCVLEGTSRFVEPPDAEAFIVSALSENGLELHWIERGAQGLSCTHEMRADGSASALLSFDRVIAAEDARVASIACGASALSLALDCAAVAASAELLGVMDSALGLTLDYLRARVQFGKPIGSFQALQHRAVDLHLQKELSRAALAGACAALHDPACTPERRAASASGVKARASQAALSICNEAVQMHGAIGFTDEYDLGLYLNRALVLSAWLGNASAHRSRYSGLLEAAA